MLTNLESVIVRHRQVLQALFFGVCDTIGIFSYVRAISFQAYHAPQLGPILLLYLTTIFLLSCLFLILSPQYRSSLTTKLFLAATLVIILVSAVISPGLVTILNLAFMIILTLMWLFPQVLANEWGTFATSMILTGLAASYFTLTHDYLSTTLLITLLLPLLLLNFFLITPTQLHRFWYPLVLLVLSAGVLILHHQSWFGVIVTLLLMAAWFMISRRLRPSTARNLTTGAIVTLLILLLCN